MIFNESFIAEDLSSHLSQILEQSATKGPSQEEGRETRLLLYEQTGPHRRIGKVLAKRLGIPDTRTTIAGLELDAP